MRAAQYAGLLGPGSQALSSHPIPSRKEVPLAGNASSERRKAEADWKAAGRPSSGPTKTAYEDAKAKERRETSGGGTIGKYF